MNRKKVETICVFLGMFLLIGAFILSKNESSLIGIICVIIGICSAAIRLILGILGSAIDASISKSAKKEYLRQSINNQPAEGLDTINDAKIKKYLLPRAEQGIASMADQKRLIPSLIKLAPRLSVLKNHPAFKQVDEGKMDDAHGIGELIKVTESILRQIDVSAYFNKWQSLDNDTLLNAYMILDFYLHPLKGSAPGIRTARYVLSKVLIERLPQIETEEQRRSSQERYNAEHPRCSRCNKPYLIDEMHYVDDRWLCHQCFQVEFGSISYE